MKIHGIFPPVATPFTVDEEIDYKALELNFQKWNSFDLAGYVVLGSNGESIYLDTDEKEALVAKCVSLKKENHIIIGGSGCNSTRSTVDMGERLSRAGADALLVIAPGFYKGQLDDTALYNHYSYVADRSPKPVILYNMPANTGVELSVNLVVKLANHPNIIGIKDSSGDATQLASLVHRCPSDFQVLAGTASVLYPGLISGCVGGVLGLANVLPAECYEILSLYKQGLSSDAASLHKRIISPNAAVTRSYGVPGLKAALDWYGYFGGPCRKPLLPLSADKLEKLKNDFISNGFSPA